MPLYRPKGFSILKDELFQELRTSERGKGRAEVEERIGLDLPIEAAD